jgi:DNA-binding NarL/FixJ family response regulator
MTTLLIVDDHGPFREQARALLESEGYQVVGEAADAATALDLVPQLRPDVVLLDVGLPDLDGFALAARLDRAAPGSRVILVSSRDAATYGPRLTTGPALGFIRKDDLSGAAVSRLLDPPSDWGRP